MFMISDHQEMKPSRIAWHILPKKVGTDGVLQVRTRYRTIRIGLRFPRTVLARHYEWGCHTTQSKPIALARCIIERQLGQVCSYWRWVVWESGHPSTLSFLPILVSRNIYHANRYLIHWCLRRTQISLDQYTNPQLALTIFSFDVGFLSRKDHMLCVTIAKAISPRDLADSLEKI